jgi:UDP-N-acetylglucosamine--N-acetylmuramyl-(pentapeptide) pyrophosphoryl-undecaprenol N-acetylglucosamine transferase
MGRDGITDNRQYLVIAAGGTGGHMFPAQALANEMLRRGWRVALSTDSRGARYADGFSDEITKKQLDSASFSRGDLRGKLRAPGMIWRGVRDASAWFGQDTPAVIAGFGGYPSIPALSAAWMMGLPRIIHEQNGVLGRVNRLFAKRVNALACGVWPVLGAGKSAPLIHIGNPIRDEVRAFVDARYTPPTAAGRFKLLAVGGSQGARILSEKLPAAVALLPDDLRVRVQISQQVRQEDFHKVSAAYEKLGVAVELAHFFDDMPARLASTHLVISRAGASTIAEISAIGRPALLAPLPRATADHQTANAKILVDAGAAAIISDKGGTPQMLADLIADFARSPEKLTDMATKAKALGRPDATEKLADLVARIARAHHARSSGSTAKNPRF